eukprot:3185781-Rhodomonas_salina.5
MCQHSSNGTCRKRRRSRYHHEKETDETVESALGHHHEEGGLELLVGIRLLEKVLLEDGKVGKRSEDTDHAHGELHSSGNGHFEVQEQEQKQGLRAKRVRK